MTKVSDTIKKVNDFILAKKWDIEVCHSLCFLIPTFNPTRKEIDFLKEHSGLDPFVLEHLSEIKSKVIYGLMREFDVGRTTATEWFNLWFVSQIESRDKKFLGMRKKVMEKWKDYNE